MALDTFVLYDHVTLGSSSTYLPLCRLNSVLEIAENSILFTLSIALFDSR